MAKRQSLKELQERLARRLTAARAEAATASWLAIEVAGQGFLVPLVQSGEIFPWSGVQKVPFTKPWYAGVASLRGGLFGVVDLAGFLGVDAAGGDRLSMDARLVSLNPTFGVNAVLWVDRLLGLRNPSVFTSVESTPPEAPGFVPRQLTDAQGRVWKELDLGVLASQAEFLAIAA